MAWSKLKTIILIILAATNVCLFAFVAHRELSGGLAQVQARENVVDFLGEKGIAVAEDAVPREMKLKAQTVTRDRTQESALAQTLLGPQVQETSLGGGIYRYESDRGSLQFHEDGTFQGQFSDGTFPMGEEGPEECAIALARQMNFDGMVLSMESSAGENGTETRVTLGQTWEDAPLFNQRMTLVFSQNQCVGIAQGRRINGTPVEDGSSTSISVPTALVSFYQGLTAMGDVCSQVSRIQPGYISAVSANSGVSALMPVWWIDTDTGAYLLDTLSGTLSRAENI